MSGILKMHDNQIKKGLNIVKKWRTSQNQLISEWND